MQAVVELLMKVEFVHWTFCPNVTTDAAEILGPLSVRVRSKTLLELETVTNVALPAYGYSATNGGIFKLQVTLPDIVVEEFIEKYSCWIELPRSLAAF
jgi:hypothetical protein